MDAIFDFLFGSQRTINLKFKRFYTVGTVYVVNGPVGSGKSHYVNIYKSAGDVVCDIDLLRQALSASDSPYSVSIMSLSLAMRLRDALLEYVDDITLSGRNLWITISTTLRRRFPKDVPLLQSR